MMAAGFFFAHKRFAFVSIALGGLVFAFDQALKAWSTANLRYFERVELLPADLLAISRVHNRGMIGGKYAVTRSNELELYARDLPTLGWGLLAMICAFRFRAAGTGERLAYTLLLAAGASNLLDQWRLGGVVDTLQARLAASWIVPFNLADLALTLGMALLVVTLGREILRGDSRASFASARAS